MDTSGVEVKDMEPSRIPAPLRRLPPSDTDFGALWAIARFTALMANSSAIPALQAAKYRGCLAVARPGRLLRGPVDTGRNVTDGWRSMDL